MTARLLELPIALRDTLRYRFKGKGADVVAIFLATTSTTRTGCENLERIKKMASAAEKLHY
jgi:tRNA U34 2-thiouridine synthase MnmA/TrmU